MSCEEAIESHGLQNRCCPESYRDTTPIKVRARLCAECNPTWGYRKIAEAIGCNYSTVRFHLHVEYRKRQARLNLSRKKTTKQTVVDLAGGACKECGYNRCLRALEFHHLDPKEKDKTMGNMMKYSLEKVLVELQKCVLLCCRCHREVHAGIRVLN